MMKEFRFSLFPVFFFSANVNFRLTNTPVLFERSLSQACFQSFLDCLRDWDRIHQITHKTLELWVLILLSKCDSLLPCSKSIRWYCLSCYLEYKKKCTFKNVITFLKHLHMFICRFLQFLNILRNEFNYQHLWRITKPNWIFEYL